MKPSRKRALVDELRDRYRVSLTKACALFHMSRFVVRVSGRLLPDSSAIACTPSKRLRPHACITAIAGCT
uniref:Uncharacterized protein n=1 Tax=blood disease bacterium R229 TaxID=741978 RepID=G2ZUV1_9RALS|nr:hypothetical protein BDB_mp40098 [blood disease bacterium R229]